MFKDYHKYNNWMLLCHFLFGKTYMKLKKNERKNRGQFTAQQNF